MVSASGLAIVHYLADRPAPVTIRELAAVTGYSEKQLHRTTRELEQTGEIEVRRGTKNRKEIQPGSGRLMSGYQRLLAKSGHIDWKDTLTPQLLRVVWYLDSPRRISTVADRLHVTSDAVYHALDPITGRAMLNPSGPEYALMENIKPLHAVADAAAWHTHRVRIQDLASSTVIEWYDPVHCLARPQTPDGTDAFATADDWHLTGLTAFTEYDLQFFTHEEPLFWYTQHGRPAPADLACHTIMTDPGPRNVSYAMLLIDELEVDHDTLRRHGDRYGISSIVDAVIDALVRDVWDRDPRLPGSREYEQLKEQYGIAHA